MSNIIVMAFSPRNIIGCFLKKAYKGGGWGHGHPRTPLATPLVDTFISSVYIRSPMDFGVRK